MKMPAPRICAKCGATISSRLPGQSCGACLLETALGSIGDGKDDQLLDRVPPMMMDFGDYELLEEIGRGGQGVVFRARQKSLNRTVALKVIALGHWATEAHLKRFRREAEAAASLDHPRIVPIYEIGERDGACYFSMKCVEGGQLDQVVRREPLPIRCAVELIVKLARTVRYAHERGILHRDIKPGNILVDGNGEPHLTDFGLARLVETESTVTRTMEVLGTPSYIAPEQAVGAPKQLTAATDVYGLGAVFYQLLTGHPPFAGGTTYETIRLVLETEPRQPRLWNSNVDVDLETICLKCLEKDAQRRYPSALALAEDLERWLRHEPILARRTGVLRRVGKWVRRNPTSAALIGSCAALLALAGFVFLNREPAIPPSGIAVLPFENLSDDKSDASFADGLQDDILTKLGKIADLKVISRTSVMQYRGERSTRKIGQALRVSHVLEGSVRKSDGRIRLNAQLIDARTDQHVWAEHYDRDISDVFAIQSEITRAIAEQLQAKLSSQEKAALRLKPTQDSEAYDFYIRAKDMMRSTSYHESGFVEIYRKAIGLLEKAIARDPNFAFAYCLLAEANLSFYWEGERVPGSLERGEIAVEAARRLAPQAGETYLAEALFFYWGNRDYDRALHSLQEAARLLPNNVDVLRYSAWVERRLSRWEECIRHCEKAAELDPRNWLPRDDLLGSYQFLHDYAGAARIATQAVSDFPDKADYFRAEKAEMELYAGDLKAARATLSALSTQDQFAWQLWYLALVERNYDEAFRLLKIWNERHEPEDSQAPRSFLEGWTARGAGQAEKARTAFLAAQQHFSALLADRKEQPYLISQLAIVHAGLGRKEEAIREALHAVELLPISRDAVHGARMVRNLALVYCWIGDKDRAFEQLSLLSTRPSDLTYGQLKFDPGWDSLRSDPRFPQNLVEAAKPIAIE